MIFPVTPEIQEILNRYGNVPKLGRRVFPIMSELIMPEQEIWVIQHYNRYIREHMAKIAKLLDMEQTPVVDKKALLEVLKGLSEEERMELISNLSE